MEIEQWKTLGRVVNVVMSKVFFWSGEFLGSSKWLQLAVGVQHDRHLHQNHNVKDSVMDTHNKNLPSFQEFGVK